MSDSVKPKLIWVNNFLFLSTFLVAVIVVPWYGVVHGYSAGLWFALLICFSYCGLSITAGYHRLWAHKSYNAHWSMRFIYALGGAFALQNSALHWSSDHRVHHKHVDAPEKDPYAATKGLWYSHIGWMLREYQPERYADYANCRDLQRDAIVMWQHKYYVELAILMNIGVPLVIGLFAGDVWGALLLVGFLRLVLSHHTTFFINSLAHFWGSQPYTDRNTARDNGVLALFTFGEGYHNFHHLFENDYRNGIRWWQFDPTKWLINGLSYLKLASDLRRSPADRIEKMKAKMTLKKAQTKLAALPQATLSRELLEQEYELLLTRISDYYQAKKACIEAKQEALQSGIKTKLENVETHYDAMKRSLGEQRRRWRQLTAQYA
ncbi:acyl-CoA desaturase [Thaumasiovibrio subtropicus]|uniref:acyl-CoA desaturase n=1 Tax=Thaumasiovibrio subtropicus TaxID=1891207 RepID=UPI000B34BB1D|nr:fatty acid desaturase [Thaumasiovibrio subtropicus]